ncbi:MAG: adenosylmethionine decarboxylase [Alphaproteobacteria bacterium]|nr:adenosylmethionine decarboxylase [Alphaproteobacteria bacterium]
MGTKATVTKSGVKLGVVSGGRREALKLAKTDSEPVLVTEANTNAPDSVIPDFISKDHFVERNGVKFAGTHLLIELWNAKNLGDMSLTDQMLRDATIASGATLLHIHLHHFGHNAGLSGVAVLAESHISIHTWPERGYAALDIFMCGSCDPYKAIPVIRRAFEPGVVQLSEQKRGVIA